MHIFVAEDEKTIRRELTILLENAMYQVTAPENFENIPDQIIEASPDLILLDVNLPGMSGFDICSMLRQRENSCPVIFLTSRTDSMDELTGMLRGGDDYITKPFNPLELLARVKSMMRRYTSLGSIAEKNNVIRIGDVELDKDAKEVRVNGKLVKMTATEYGILQLLMENAGKVFSIDEIYERVWNESSFSPENTVSVHIRRIREKIEINPKEPRYLKVVWGIGYKIEKI